MKSIKKIISIFLCLIVLPALSQDFNEAYLNSLPAEVRDDVLNRMQEKNEEENEVYRSSANSSKIEKEEELIELKFRLEKDLKELEERLMSSNENEDPNDLVLFGSNFFKNVYSSFMPINEPSMDSSYVLDYGDTLEIQSVNQENLNDKYPIKRDGSIFIPEIGELILSGLTLEEASSLIKSKVKGTFLGAEVYISLANIRDINILVSGNAFNPGVYTLSGNSTLLHAVEVAGGVNEFGSYRDISLLRNGKIIEKLDVYDVLINGKISVNNRLRSGDVVFISPAHNIVSIYGGIKRPAKYELLEDQNLIDIINYANGLSNDSDVQNISLNRVLDGKVKSIPILSLSQFNSISSNDGDAIYIRKHSFREVAIKGAVIKPGNYLMSEGDTIFDLIDKAGGYSKNAYPFGAVFETQDALNINKMAKDVLYEKFIDNIILAIQQTASQNSDLTPLFKLAEDIKNTKPNGRIVVDLFDENTNNAPALKEGDSLIIPEQQKHVYIYGEVSYEGALLYDLENDLEYYINTSGGYTNQADKSAIYVLHPNGNTERFLKNRNIFANQSKVLKMNPGSIIFVPRKTDNSALNRISAQAYATILGNIGVTLASISALSD